MCHLVAGFINTPGRQKNGDPAMMLVYGLPHTSTPAAVTKAIKEDPFPECYVLSSVSHKPRKMRLE